VFEADFGAPIEAIPDPYSLLQALHRW
jgi:hypothetical protein